MDWPRMYTVCTISWGWAGLDQPQGTAFFWDVRTWSGDIRLAVGALFGLHYYGVKSRNRHDGERGRTPGCLECAISVYSAFP